MLLFDLGPIYTKSAILLKKNSEEMAIFEESLLKIDKFNFFKPNLFLEIKSHKIYFYKINCKKFDEFSNSSEFSIINDILKYIRNNKTCEINLISTNIDNDKIMNNPKIKIFSENTNKNKLFENNKINAYFCGVLQSELETCLEDLFNCKLIKTGHTNQLSIQGLDYIFNNVEKSFFYLPGQKISNLVKVGKLDEEVTEKTYTNLNDELYPFIMSNILEGTSVYKIENLRKFERIGGNSLGASSYWALVSMICGYDDPEKAVEDGLLGNNELIDLSVGDMTRLI